MTAVPEFQQGIVPDASTRKDINGQHPSHMEELTQFHRWSMFLPRGYSEECQKNHAYTRTRHTRNPKFFEETRARLTAILGDLQVLKATGLGSTAEEALEAVMQAQWAAHGFLFDRQFHKALNLGELSMEVVESLAAQVQESDVGGLTFWRLLTRANLGNAYARFKQSDKALAVLKQGLELAEQDKGLIAANDLRAFGEGDTGTSNKEVTKKSVARSRERVLAGTIYAHLSRIHLEAEDQEEALRLMDLMLEAFERYIWDLGDAREDREAEATVLATAYSNRGVCDVRRGKHDNGLAWLTRAQECLEKHADVSGDSVQILAMIKEHIVCANHLRN
jgi:tetratricopeptide (TPR) repeat protein